MGAGEHWALLGPNGAGKTTLLRLASTELFPSFGEAAIFGHRRGTVHVDRIRPRIGLVQRGVADRFSPALSVLDVVITGVTGTIALLASRIGAKDRRNGPQTPSADGRRSPRTPALQSLFGRRAHADAARSGADR